MQDLGCARKGNVPFIIWAGYNPHERDGRAASGGMMIYFNVRMIVAVKPASPDPNPPATPVRAAVGRN